MLTDRQTDRQTDKRGQKHVLPPLSEVITVASCGSYNLVAQGLCMVLFQKHFLLMSLTEAAL